MADIWKLYKKASRIQSRKGIDKAAAGKPLAKVIDAAKGSAEKGRPHLTGGPLNYLLNRGEYKDLAGKNSELRGQIARLEEIIGAAGSHPVVEENAEMTKLLESLGSHAGENPESLGVKAKKNIVPVALGSAALGVPAGMVVDKALNKESAEASFIQNRKGRDRMNKIAFLEGYMHKMASWGSPAENLLDMFAKNKKMISSGPGHADLGSRFSAILDQLKEQAPTAKRFQNLKDFKTFKGGPADRAAALEALIPGHGELMDAHYGALEGLLRQDPAVSKALYEHADTPQEVKDWILKHNDELARSAGAEAYAGKDAITSADTLDALNKAFQATGEKSMDAAISKMMVLQGRNQLSAPENAAYKALAGKYADHMTQVRNEGTLNSSIDGRIKPLEPAFKGLTDKTKEIEKKIGDSQSMLNQYGKPLGLGLGGGLVASVGANALMSDRRR